MSTHTIGFYEEISRIITYYQISSKMHLISSAVPVTSSATTKESFWLWSLTDVYLILLFLFEVDSSSSGSLGKAMLFHRGTPSAFHLINLQLRPQVLLLTDKNYPSITVMILSFRTLVWANSADPDQTAPRGAV